MLAYRRVRELFDYRPDGCLIWKVRRGKAAPGKIAGCGGGVEYTMVGIDGIIYPAHRIIWLWHHGYMPEDDLDHINRIKSDNRIGNLREVSMSCNMRNAKMYRTNKTGVKGICGDGVYQVQINANGKNNYIGRFKDFDEAVLARLAVEQCLDWAGCDSSSPAYMYAVNRGLISRTKAMGGRGV